MANTKTQVRVAWATALLSVALGVTLWSANSGAQMPEEITLRPRSALRTAIEHFRRGDYENADRYYQQALAGQADLSATDRQDLQKLVQQNNVALKGRRDGVALLTQAEQAMAQGKTQEARDYLKAANANQYLGEADRKTMASLNDRLRGVPGNAMGKNVTTTVDPANIEIKGTDAKSFLAAARQELDKGHYEYAEALCKEAEKKSSSFTWMPWGDSPTKVRHEIQVAQARNSKTLPPPAPVAQLPEKKETPSTIGKVKEFLTPPWMRDKKPEEKVAVEANVKPPEFPSAPKETTVKKPAPSTTDLGPVATAPKSPMIDAIVPPPGPRLPPAEATAKARRLIDEGYKALAANDVEKAHWCAEQAKSLQPDLDWKERNPDRLLAECQRKTGSSSSVATATPAAPNTGSPTDAKAWVKQGRVLLQQDKVDDAEKLCTKAAQVHGTHWGLFEDSPERLRTDILEARSRGNREKSKLLMADARKLYAAGNLQEAKAKAWQAQQLHGPYTVWDMGDRPQKLLDDIARAEAGNHKVPVLPKDPGIPNPTEIAKTSDAIRPLQSSLLLTTASTQGAKRQEALTLIAQARDLERRGFLVEARAKAVEADRLGVQFGADEDNPRNVMLSLASKTDQRIQQLLQQATELVRNNPNDVTRFEKAEINLTNARKLADTFGLDQNLINQHMMWLQQAAAQNRGIRPIEARDVQGPGLQTADFRAPMSENQTSPKTIGDELLAKALLELKAGNYTLARRMAEEAYKPNFGVQQQAGNMLRTIDAEEHLHQVTMAQRNFEAGLECFVRHDYTRANQFWQSVDTRLLPLEKQRQFAELMQEARSGGPTGVTPVVNNTPAGPNGGAPGVATVTDQNPRSNDVFTRYAQMEELQMQKLRDRSLDAMGAALKLAQENKTQQAVDTLKDFLEQLKSADINQDRAVNIRRQVEAKLNQYNTLLAQITLQKQAVDVQRLNPETVRNFKLQKMHDEVGKLLQESRSEFKEGHYKKALVLANQAKELDHDNVATDALIGMCNIKIASETHEFNKGRNEDHFLEALNNDQGQYANMKDPLKYDRNVYDRAKNRKIDPIAWHSKDATERNIETQLEQPNNFYWKDAPLGQVIEDLSIMSGINVVPDVRALKDAGVSLDMPMSLKLERVKLKSALNIMLSQAKLTYVISDQVLKITTESEAKGKTKNVIHPVADLVIPVENHQTPEVNNFNSALMRHIQRNGAMNYGGGTPYMPPMSLPNSTGLPVGHYGNSQQDVQRPAGTPDGFMQNPNNKLLPGQTMENLLMDLIKNAVSQNSWSDSGGPGTIQYYPLGMALVVNQTLEVQEEVAALLQSLRRLQDLEVAIEMRMVSVSEAFFERMGLDFDINIKTPHSRNESQLLSGQFAPFGSINRNLGVNNVISGVTPAGTLTPDLNVPIKSSSYDFTIPPFGGFPGTFGSNGGLSLGLAFLNDIQVFMFLEAASGDRRTNVMQAPKITVFNGQVANISVQDQQFFLVDVQVAVPNNGNQLLFIPNQAPFPLGVSLQVTPVVSADRRFVRINLIPQLTNLASATVPLFPVQVVVPQFFDGPGNNSSTNTQPQIFQTFFQQPTFTQINLNTTVNVPDGGTVLLGGLKTLSEGRNEYGPPILSKIPYLNRLFRNIGYGRESQSLMIMVTPRIIINEEEEQILLGQLPAIPR